MEFVRPAGAGQWLGKTRTPALLDRKSVAAAAPFCGETPTADFDISSLVRPRYFMSSSCRLHSDLVSVLLSKARTLGSIAIAVRVSLSSEEVEAD